MYLWCLSTDAPPAYVSSDGNAGISGAQQLTSPTTPSEGYYSGTAAAILSPSVYDAGDAVPPMKM